MRGPRFLGPRTLFLKAGENTGRSLRDKLFCSPINVTDFITQYDEVRQLESKRKETKAMARGREIHDSLLAHQNHFNFFVHGNPEDPQERVQVAGTVLDRLRVLNARLGGIRELRVRGTIGGYHIHGMIDQLKILADQLVVVEIKTTRNLDIDDCRLRLAYHQALFYHFLLEKMLKPGYDLGELGLREGDEHEKVSENLTSENPELFPKGSTVADIFLAVGNELQILSKWSNIANFVQVQFINSRANSNGEIEQRLYEIPYDPETRLEIEEFRLALIRGNREPLEMPLKDYCPSLVLEDIDSSKKVI